MNPREVHIEHFPKTVNQLFLGYISGSLIIPQVPEQYEGEPVEQILLGTFRNEFLFTRSRSDMKLTLRTNIPFIRSIFQFANGERVARESSFYPIQGKHLEEISPILYNKFLDTVIHCCYISPSTPDEIVPYLVQCYNKT